MAIATYLEPNASAKSRLSDSAISDILSPALYSDGRALQSVEVVRTTSMVADGAAIFLLDGDHVLFLSPADYPDASAEQARAMQTMTVALGRPRADLILPIVATGTLAGRSYLILPRCEPLAGGRLRRLLQTPKVTAAILGWLRQLATGHRSADDDGGAEFRRSFQALVAMDDIGAKIRADAARLDEALAGGTLAPRHVPMHGDLWRNNIMMRPGGGGLAVIDWAGGTPAGYAIYDLIRFHQSFNLPAKTLRQELAWYRDALGDASGGDAMIRAHLLGALGHYANRLGEFPRERFVAMADDCYRAVDSALVELARG